MNHNRQNNITIGYLLIAILTISLASCSIYGKYQPTEEIVDSVFVPKYTDIFLDPLLQQYIEIGLHNNLDLAIAHQRVAQAEAVLLGAKLSFLPSVGAGGTPVASMSSANGQMALNGGHTFATASWELDIFGKKLNSMRMNRATYQQSLDFQQAARAELIASIAQTYFTLLQLDAQIQVTDSAVGTWQRSVTTLKAMKQAGLNDEAAVAQFEGSLYAAKVNAQALRLARTKTENAMNVLLNQPIGEPIKRSQLNSQLIGKGLDNISLRAVATRPDVQAAARQMEYAFYRKNLSKSNCCPNISISGTIGWATEGLIYGAVGNLLQPIFNSGKNIAEVRTANAYQKETQLSYSKALLQAGMEVNNALAAKKSTTIQIEDRLKQVNALQRAFDATQTKMNLGYGTYLEVLIARNDLFTALNALIECRTQILLSDIELFLALGGGKD